MPPQPRHIGDILKDRNIELATSDPIVRGGFTQVPNFILKDPAVSLGAKVAYALLLSFYWYNNQVFPGQERLAADMGMSVSRANDFIKELETRGLIDVTRRGQGRTNLYKLNYVVTKKSRRRSSKS
jgi:hypothetical protein